MGGDQKELSGPDLARGVPFGELQDGRPLLGHAGGEAVMLVREGAEVHAIAATCSHYGGPLAEGLVADGTVRCPWHHACFDLKTGAAQGPGLTSIACFDVVRDGTLVKLGPRRAPTKARPATAPRSVVIVGAGPAGGACAETLRAGGYEGRITLIGGDEPGTLDRPNLSKDYLAGTAPEDWVTLRSPDAFAQERIDLVLGDPATSVDVKLSRLALKSGRTLEYGALLLATGAEPVRLSIDGVTLPHVHTLRSLDDARAIIARATTIKQAAVLGSSFIGLEAAASLRARGVDVIVIAPDAIPLGRLLGDEVGRFVQGVHEAHGVTFRLGRKPVRISATDVTLDDESRVPAALVVMGVGVRPRTALAEHAGLRVDNGIVVDERLAAAPNVYAAGDVARFPYAGEPVRIEHWAVAMRQGQAVARAMLGEQRPFRSVPFFWSQHYDMTISYVGYGGGFDHAEVRGNLDARDACVVYRRAGRIRALATVGRDELSLRAELCLERGDDAALERLLATS